MKKKEYVVLIAASLYASDDEEAKRKADEYAQYMQRMNEYNQAGIYRLTDVSPNNVKDWRRVIDL